MAPAKEGWTKILIGQRGRSSNQKYLSVNETGYAVYVSSLILRELGIKIGDKVDIFRQGDSKMAITIGDTFLLTRYGVRGAKLCAVRVIRELNLKPKTCTGEYSITTIDKKKAFVFSLKNDDLSWGGGVRELDEKNH